MSEEAWVKQMRAEEKLHAAEISKALTLELNSKKTQAAAAEVVKSSQPWPYPPTREMLKFYETTVANAWSKMESGYKHLEVEIAVDAPAGKIPTATATVTYKGEFVGGKSYELQPGDSIISVAKDVYGHEAYAAAIWEENSDILGNTCKVLPAGFGIRIPRIFVADWKKSPKTPTLASGAKSKAVKVMYPTVEAKFESKSEQTYYIDIGTFMLEVKVEVTGSLKVQKKGTIDATFNLREYTLDIGKNLGPLEGGYSFNLREGKGTADIALTNSNIKGLGGTTKISLKEGGIKFSYGTKKVSYTYKDYTVEGSVTVSATGKLYPKPSASAPSTSRAPSRAVNWDAVFKVVLIGAVVVLAGVAIAGSGGTAAPFAAAGAAAVILIIADGGKAPSGA